MTERDLREIKRRFRPQRCNIPRIVGCFVGANKNIISRISQPLSLTDTVLSEKLLGIMKKTLSGSLGTNLTEIDFTTREVESSKEHALLMELRRSGLKDEAVLERFYSAVIESVSFDSNYVILLANDIYDVVSHSKDGEEEDSYETFSYIVAAICPVKSMPEALSFGEADSLFHTLSASALLSPPSLGFMFPAFDERHANIYGALYYVRSISESYPDFTARIFAREHPMPPKAQMEAFGECLASSLADECTLDVIRSVHAEICNIVEAHKESKSPEPLVISKATVSSVLEGCGVDREKIEKLEEKMDESFGEGKELSPRNIVPIKRFELKMPEVSVKVSPEHRDLVKAQVINNVKYVLIRADAGVSINGINVSFDEE